MDKCVKSKNKLQILFSIVFIALFIFPKISFCQDEPMINYEPEEISFTAISGGANPLPQTLYIWNNGTGTLNWSITDDASWLTLNPISGSSIDENNKSVVTLSVDITGLAAGVYEAEVVISELNDPVEFSFITTLTLSSPSGGTTGGGGGCYFKDPSFKEKEKQIRLAKFSSNNSSAVEPVK